MDILWNHHLFHCWSINLSHTDSLPYSTSIPQINGVRSHFYFYTMPSSTFIPYHLPLPCLTIFNCHTLTSSTFIPPICYFHALPFSSFIPHPLLHSYLAIFCYYTLPPYSFIPYHLLDILWDHHLFHCWSISVSHTDSLRYSTSIPQNTGIRSHLQFSLSLSLSLSWTLLHYNFFSLTGLQVLSLYSWNIREFGSSSSSE